MAAPTAQILTPLNKDDVYTDIAIIWNALVPDILALQPTEPAPAMLSPSVIEWFVDDAWNPYVVPALQAQFGDSAFGDWLTLLAATLWHRPRLTAQAGTMTVVVENHGSFFGSTAIRN